MRRDWRHYLANSRTAAGRALVLKGIRLAEAKDALPDKRFRTLLTDIGLKPRDAQTLMYVGRRIGPLIDSNIQLELPMRIQTLRTLSELSTERLHEIATDGKLHVGMTDAEARSFRGASKKRWSPIIKSTDNWNFHKIRWVRIDDDFGHGYIPGEIYANCIWYYAQDGDTVLDPMAGSGMLLQVWNDREEWLSDENFDIHIEMSDLIPRGRFQSYIKQCDLLSHLPIGIADYVIVDPPYCGSSAGQFSDLENDLANMSPANWIAAMSRIASQLRSIQGAEGRCTVIVPNGRSLNGDKCYLFPESVRRSFAEAGYELIDVVYASRRAQQSQSRRMGVLNNVARANKALMSDVAEILTFAAT